MAGRSKQVGEAEEPELPEAEDEPEQEEAQGEVADEVVAEPRPRRTGKARAPRRSDTAPAARPRGSRGAAAGRRAPRQLSLFSRERLSQNATRTGGSILLSLLAIGGLVVLFYFFAGSRFFALRGVDVTGNKLLSADDVEAMVKPNVPRGVLNADLDKIRRDLKEYPLIREAEVGRLLPDRLRIVIVEREPVALARRSDGSVVCVDDEGVMFGDNSLWRGRTPPPLISGLAESGERASEINRQYVMTYRRLLADLDQTEPPLSSRIDEVYFDEDQGIRLILADSRVAVLIGSEDFRARLNAALDVLDAVRNRDAERLNVLRISDAERLLSGVRIAYLNATDPKRVIVGLDE
jgi:cell division septal protein FtsQ